jgi:hypothetical protein
VKKATRTGNGERVEELKAFHPGKGWDFFRRAATHTTVVWSTG